MRMSDTTNGSNANALAVCTPMTRLPTVTSTAWHTAIAASSSQRPRYAWRTVTPSTPSVSTSSRMITMSTKAPIHSDRFVNRAAIAEPYAWVGKRTFSSTSTGEAMNRAI